MPEGPNWLAIMIQGAVWFLAMTLVMGWLARTRLAPAKRTATGTELKLPLGMLAISIVGMTLFTGLAIASSFADAGPVVAGLFITFAVLSAYLAYEYFNDRFEQRADGITMRPLFGGERFVPWPDVASVRFGSVGNWIVVKDRGGGTMRLSVMMIGLPALAEALLSNVPAELIAPNSLEVLHATAEGHPPSIWG
jgi:hypothetical protein